MGCKKSYTLLRIACLIGVRLLVPPPAAAISSGNAPCVPIFKEVPSMPYRKDKKRVLLIGTGGTIASEVTEGGLAPELTTEQLLRHVPGISDICAVDCLQLLKIGRAHV